MLQKRGLGGARLVRHVGWLARNLAMKIGDQDGLNRIADVLLRSQTELGRPYVDVADLCVNLARESGDAATIDAAIALGDLLASPRPAVVGSSEKGVGRPIIVEHGRNAGRLARLNGISLYAPHLAPMKNSDVVEGLYKKFSFFRQTLWSDLVHTIARS